MAGKVSNNAAVRGTSPFIYSTITYFIVLYVTRAIFFQRSSGGVDNVAAVWCSHVLGDYASSTAFLIASKVNDIAQDAPTPKMAYWEVFSTSVLTAISFSEIDCFLNLPLHPAALVCVLADDTEEMRRPVDACGNDTLDGCGISTVDGHIHRSIVEREIKFTVFVPCDKEVLPVLVKVVVVADEDGFLAMGILRGLSLDVFGPTRIFFRDQGFHVVN